MISISYCLTVCNETQEFKKLFDFLINNIRENDEICILVDEPKCPSNLKELIQDLSPLSNVKIKFDSFNNNFGEWKNKLFDLAKKDYLFFIDADEMISKEIIEDVPHILDQYKIENLGISRENLVEGITEDYIRMMGWIVDDENRVNWPDVQFRILANKEHIRWKNKVHEVPHGYSTISVLPGDRYYLIHHKSFDKQKKQNELYSQI